MLIARIYEVFPLLCPLCGGQMRIIAFITHSADIRHILEHIGVDSEPPRIKPARGPPLWDGCDTQGGEGMEPVPDWDEAAQLVPDFEVKYETMIRRLANVGGVGASLSTAVINLSCT